MLKFLTACSLLFAFSEMAFAAPEGIEFGDPKLKPVSEKYNLVCGIADELLIYIKEGQIIDFRGNLEFNSKSSNPETWVAVHENGNLVGFAATPGKDPIRLFIVPPPSKDDPFAMYEKGTHQDGKVYGFQAMDGCAKSVESYFKWKFVKKF